MFAGNVDVLFAIAELWYEFQLAQECVISIKTDLQRSDYVILSFG